MKKNKLKKLIEQYLEKPKEPVNKPTSDSSAKPEKGIENKFDPLDGVGGDIDSLNPTIGQKDDNNQSSGVLASVVTLEYWWIENNWLDDYGAGDCVSHEISDDGSGQVPYVCYGESDTSITNFYLVPNYQIQTAQGWLCAPQSELPNQNNLNSYENLVYWIMTYGNNTMQSLLIPGNQFGYISNDCPGCAIDQDMIDDGYVVGGNNLEVATLHDGSCEFVGCYESNQSNYLCILFPDICNASNFIDSAIGFISENNDNSSCVLSGCTDNGNMQDAGATSGWWVNSGYAAITGIPGYPAYQPTNYTPGLSSDDGSCIYDLDNDGTWDWEETSGCNVPGYFNTDTSFTETCADDDGDGVPDCCVDIVVGCIDQGYLNYSSIFNTSCSDNTAPFGVGDCCGDQIVHGCTDSTAVNYNELANVDNGTCIDPVNGCIDEDACNYNTSANTDDGSCEYTSCLGCQIQGFNGNGEDPSIGAYDASATIEGECFWNGCMDGSTDLSDDTFVMGNYVCVGAFSAYLCITNDEGILVPNTDLGTFIDSGGCIQDAVDGCTDPSACNYDPYATANDGSCDFTSCAGCIDNTTDGTGYYYGNPVAEGGGNYLVDNLNFDATLSDASCNYVVCLDTVAENYVCDIYPYLCTAAGFPNSSYGTFENCIYDQENFNLDDAANTGTCCTYIIEGCTEGGDTITNSLGIEADNYDPNATINDGSCEFTGCMISTACNYDPVYTELDESLCDFDTCAGCTDTLACNTDEEATIDDGSCEYPEQGYDCEGEVLADGCYTVLAKQCSPNLDSLFPTFTQQIPPGFGQGQGSWETHPSFGLVAQFNCITIGGEYPNTSTNSQFSMPSGGVWFSLIEGCLDESACNYDPDAHIPNPDDPCIYPNGCGNCNGDMDCIGCMDATAFNYDETATIPCSDNSGNQNTCCEPVLVGCMDESWMSYNPYANTSDSSLCQGELKLYTCKECPVLNYTCGSVSFGYTNNHPSAYCDALKSDGQSPGSCGGWNGNYCEDQPGNSKQYWQPGLRLGGFRCVDELGDGDCCAQGKYSVLWHQDWNHKDDLKDLCSSYPGGLDDQCGSDFWDILALDFNGDYCWYAAGGWNEFGQWLESMVGVPDIPCEQDDDQCTSPCFKGGVWKTHPLLREVYDPLCGGPSTLGQGTTNHSLPIDEWNEWVGLYDTYKGY